jgi:alkyldihydroxyacetonephosphate synthase
MKELEGKVNQITLEDKERAYHSHGHTVQDIFTLRHSKQLRSVDAVAYVRSHEECETLV